MVLIGNADCIPRLNTCALIFQRRGKLQMADQIQPGRYPNRRQKNRRPKEFLDVYVILPMWEFKAQPAVPRTWREAATNLLGAAVERMA